MQIHLDIKVRGKVQGVNFRAFTKRKAEALGLKGIVKNMDDGSVFIEAEGEESLMNDFLNWCREGSPSSKVSKVESTGSEMRGFIDFRVG
jgi:acylphosphatase